MSDQRAKHPTVLRCSVQDLFKRPAVILRIRVPPNGQRKQGFINVHELPEIRISQWKVPEQHYLNIPRDEIVNEARRNHTRDAWQNIPPEHHFPGRPFNKRHQRRNQAVDHLAAWRRHARTSPSPRPAIHRPGQSEQRLKGPLGLMLRIEIIWSREKPIHRRHTALQPLSDHSEARSTFCDTVCEQIYVSWFVRHIQDLE